MSEGRPRFSIYSHFYTWFFVVGLSLAPLAVALHRLRHDADHPAIPWPAVLGAIVLIQLLFQYTQFRCSSDQLGFWDGMNYVASFSSTGWGGFSFFFVLMALALMSGLAFLIALYGEVRLRPELSKQYFMRLINFFYRNRMVQ